MKDREPSKEEAALNKAFVLICGVWAVIIIVIVILESVGVLR